MLKTSKKLLPRSTYLFWLSRSSSACPWLHSRGPLTPLIYLVDYSMLYVPCRYILFYFFYFKMGCQNAIKTRKKIICKQLRKVLKIYFSSFSHVGGFKEVWYKGWKVSLYKSGQIRVCFCWITEKSQIIQLNISFHYHNFCVDFFQRRWFCEFY